MSALRRVGHKGADLIAPGNTRESFDAALEACVDMIECDVLPARWPAGETFALHPHMQTITLQVILRAVFGLDEGAQMDELAALLVEYTRPPPSLMNSSNCLRFARPVSSSCRARKRIAAFSVES